jgi:hypothetical protein
MNIPISKVICFYQSSVPVNSTPPGKTAYIMEALSKSCNTQRFQCAARSHRPSGIVFDSLKVHRVKVRAVRAAHCNHLPYVICHNPKTRGTQMQTNSQKLLDLLDVSSESMVSKSQLINIAMYFKEQNDNIKNIISELTFELFKVNPTHPRFAEFSEADRNRLRVLKFGGRIRG